MGCDSHHIFLLIAWTVSVGGNGRDVRKNRIQTLFSRTLCVEITGHLRE